MNPTHQSPVPTSSPAVVTSTVGAKGSASTVAARPACQPGCRIAYAHRGLCSLPAPVTTERYSYATFSGPDVTGVLVQSERLAAYLSDRHGDIEIGEVSVSHAEAEAFCRAVLAAIAADRKADAR